MVHKAIYLNRPTTILKEAIHLSGISTDSLSRGPSATVDCFPDIGAVTAPGAEGERASVTLENYAGGGGNTALLFVTLFTTSTTLDP